MKQAIKDNLANLYYSTPKIAFLILPVFGAVAYGFYRALALLEAVQNS